MKAAGGSCRKWFCREPKVTRRTGLAPLASATVVSLAVTYRDANTKFDVFLYDLRASVIPTGIRGSVIQQSFKYAIDDLESASQRGLYSGFRLRENRKVQLGSQPFLHARFSYGEDLLLKDGHLLVAGVNGKILKIRATLTQPTHFDVWRAFGHFANSIEQSRPNGYGGVNPASLLQLEQALTAVDPRDGLSAEEAQAIAQMQIVPLKLHNRFDVETAATVGGSGGHGHQLVRFAAFPTAPARVEPRFLTIAIATDGQAYMLSMDQ